MINIYIDDITKGHKGSCRYCPIALAINRHLKEGYYCTVGPNTFQENKGSIIIKYSGILPVEAAKFTENYDHGYAVKPFSIQLSMEGEWWL